MQVKILRRPMIAAAVAIVIDLAVLVSAVVLDSIRGSFQSEYSYTIDIPADMYIVTESHPYDISGIFFAVALVIAAVMSAVILIGALSKNRVGQKAVSEVVGAAVLLVISAAVILFSYFIVNGSKPSEMTDYSFTDETLQLIIREEKYSEDEGITKIFLIDDEKESIRLLAMAEISEFAESAERYSISWVTDNTLYIAYSDREMYKTLQINI